MCERRIAEAEGDDEPIAGLEHVAGRHLSGRSTQRFAPRRDRRPSPLRGGQANTASGVFSFVGGGAVNWASGNFSLVGGGSGNVASGLNSFVGGGSSSVASGQSSFVGGGFANTAGPNTCGFVIATVFGVC